MKTEAFDYDLAVIGGDAAGFVSSKLAIGLGINFKLRTWLFGMHYYPVQDLT